MNHRSSGNSFKHKNRSPPNRMFLTVRTFPVINFIILLNSRAYRSCRGDYCGLQQITLSTVDFLVPKKLRGEDMVQTCCKFFHTTYYFDYEVSITY